MAAKYMEYLNTRNKAVSLVAAVDEVRRHLGTKPLGTLDVMDCDFVAATDPGITIGELAEHFSAKQSLSAYLSLSDGPLGCLLVDVLDLLHWTVQRAPAGFNLRNISEHFTSVADVRLQDIAGGLGTHISAVSSSSTLEEVLPMFAQNLSHLVPLQNPETKQVSGAISITAIMRMLHTELQAGNFRTLAHVPVEKILAALPAITTIKGTDTVLAAMHKLHTKSTRYSAAAVVASDAGMTAGCFSARDLCDIYTGRISVMARVSEFLKSRIGSTCVCTPSTNLQEVISDMLAMGRHHAFVVDNHYAPIACISMSDIAAIICDPASFSPLSPSLGPAARSPPSSTLVL